MNARLPALGLLVVAFSVAAWVGCGGSSGTIADILEGDAGIDGDANGGGNRGSNDAASGTDSSAALDSSSAGGDAGITSNGGDGGISPADAGPGGNTATINCGTTTCSIPSQTCCVASSGGGALAYSCSAADAGCAAPAGGDSIALTCSSGANCALGTVCCVRQTTTGAASVCKPACEQNEAQLCDPKASDAGCVNQTCSNNNISDWGLPSSYATCGGKGN